MPTCPSGHDSPSDDFCDVCGIRIGGAPPATAPSAVGAPATPVQPAGPPCPQCGAPRTGQFCEACGHNFTSTAASATRLPTPARPTAPEPPLAAVGPDRATALTPVAVPAAPVPDPGSPAWTATVTASRTYFETVIASEGPDAGAIQFPAYIPERQFRLAGREMRIGRRSVSRGLEPEIDLTGPPADPGVSHLHAVLVAEPDGGWAILDPGSANGTQVNDGEIPSDVRVPLHDGDRICLGAWTMLTISRIPTPG
jgi:hypothetical protein